MTVQFIFVLYDQRFLLYKINKNISKAALAGVAQRIECWPENQRVAGSIPSGHMPGLQARSPVGDA